MLSFFKSSSFFITILLLSQPLFTAANSFEEAPPTLSPDPAPSTDPAAPAAPADPNTPVDPTAPQDTGFATLLLCLVNKERSAQGLSPLGLDPRLVQSSQVHSNDQARRRTMTHDGEDGSTPGRRVTKQGLNWRAVGENVAYGYRDMYVTMKEWMDSPGHRANILNGRYTMFGGAVAYNGKTPYYTQDFAFDGQPARNVPTNCPVSSSSEYKQMPAPGTTSDQVYMKPSTPKKTVHKVKKQQ
jgi:uncharacterized protein YkwD